jgi:hypothetical protein
MHSSGIKGTPQRLIDDEPRTEPSTMSIHRRRHSVPILVNLLDLEPELFS